LPDIEAVLSRVFDADSNSLRITGFGFVEGEPGVPADPVVVQRNDVEVVAELATLDFSSDFGVTNSPDGEANITIGSVIARQSAVDALTMADIAVDGSGFTGLLDPLLITNGQELATFIDTFYVTATNIVLDAADFVGNLDVSIVDLQLFANRVDELVLGAGSGTVTSVNEIEPVLGNVTLIAADLNAVDLDVVGEADGVVPLDGAGLISTTYMPPYVVSVNSMDGVVTFDAASIDVDVSDFDGILSSSDLTIQDALNTIDDLDITNDAAPLRELSQDATRRAGTIWTGRIRTQLVTDLWIGDSIARGAGGTLGSSDVSTVYAKMENNAAGTAYVGPGIKLITLDETPYGSFEWDSVTGGIGATGPAAGYTSSHTVNNATLLADTDRFRRVEVFFHKAASGSGNIEISTDGGSSWSSPVSTTGTGYGSWLSADLGSCDTRTLQVRGTSATAATIIGYRGYLTDGTAGFVADNVAKGGTDTNDWVTDRGWETYATLTEPRRIVICIGENDALTGVSLATMIANLTTIVQRAKAAAPLAEIVVVGEQYAWVTGLTDVTFAGWSDTWIPAIEQVCIDEEVTFLDHNEIFGDCSENGDPYTITMDGGLHFGVAGQRARAEVMFDRLSRAYAFPDVNPTFIQGGTNSAGRKWYVGDVSGDVGLQLFADEGHTYPAIAFGTLSGSPLLAYGAGTAAADILIGRSSTPALTIQPGWDVTNMAGGGEIRARDFGSNSPAIGFYAAEADTQPKLSVGTFFSNSLIAYGAGGSTTPDVWHARSSAGTLRQTDGAVDEHGALDFYTYEAFSTQTTGLSVFSDTDDTQPGIRLLTAGGAPSLNFGPGGSTATDTALTRSSAGVFAAPGLAVDTGTGEIRIVAASAEPVVNCFATAGDTYPVVGIGTIVGTPVLAMGPGSSTAPDFVLARTGTGVASLTGRIAGGTVTVLSDEGRTRTSTGSDSQQTFINGTAPDIAANPTLGDIYVGRAAGACVTDTTNRTFTLRVTLDTTAMLTFATAAIASAGAYGWTLDWWFRIAVLGSGTTARIEGGGILRVLGNIVTTTLQEVTGLQNRATGFDSTQAITLDLTNQNSNIAVSNECYGLTIVRHNAP
jgi:hypothetical protein